MLTRFFVGVHNAFLLSPRRDGIVDFQISHQREDDLMPFFKRKRQRLSWWNLECGIPQKLCRFLWSDGVDVEARAPFKARDLGQFGNDL